IAMKQFSTFFIVATVGLLSACSDKAAENTQAPAAQAPETVASEEVASTAAEPAAATGFFTTEVAKFNSPWAMTFLPDGRLLVTEMAGTLHLYDPVSETTGTISGVPEVNHVAQGGLGD